MKLIALSIAAVSMWLGAAATPAGLTLSNERQLFVDDYMIAEARNVSRVIHPVIVSIRLGQPIETAGLKLDDRSALIERVRAQIAALLAAGPIRD